MNFQEKTVEEKIEFLNNHEGDFSDISHPLSRSKTTHAFLVFERVLGDDLPVSMIAGSEHDVIFLLEPETEIIFFSKAKQQDIEEIACCSIFFSEEFDCLIMFT
tara:strand:- start:145 stop:456 length:312 start_codon:yes stop_codon:yes gene_type:complete